MLVVALGALALTASALAQSGHRSGHSMSATVVTTKKTALGTILVTGTGKTLYLDAQDKPGHPACTGGCLAIWPPLKASGTVTAAGQAKKADLGTIKIAGGIKQVTYNKHPLYLFVSAGGKGTSGQGKNGFWVVSTMGHKITKSNTTTTTKTSTGYGY
jgi:predicted lipoprotein with Yx(FWY)xxD motif